jgi:hypothetical protein
VNVFRITQRHIPDNRTLHSRCCENLMGIRPGGCFTDRVQNLPSGLCIQLFTICAAINRDSSVGIAMGCTVGVRFPAGAIDFSLLCSIQTGSGAHPASIESCFAGSKSAGTWSWPLTSI